MSGVTAKKSNKPFTCAVCKKSMAEGVINYNYMLTTETWSAAGMKTFELAHIGCVEKKLDRVLVREDFRKCPLNNLIMWLFDRGIPIPKD